MAESRAAISLLTAKAVRTRAQQMLDIGQAGRLPNFRVDLPRLGAATDLTLETTRRNYPKLNVPFHSRWRHFVVSGEDRWSAFSRQAPWKDAAGRARSAFDLAIVSVLLDAGAGPAWRYRDAATRATIGRSEGLAIASFDMFVQGAFSLYPGAPLRADAEALKAMDAERLARGFQVSADNPLVGLDGRVALLQRLGERVAEASEIFGREDTPRPGGLFDHLVARTHGGAVAAPEILAQVLEHLGPIWPSRLELGGVPLGDCWYHPSIVSDDASNGLVPLHKLSQWLTYSLIEPLQQAGVTVTDIDGLTGLAEYRNGGLFVDCGVLVLRDPAQAALEHEVSSELVVEWRALTVALLDKLAEEMRKRLRMNAENLPLAKVLEGGTWAAGRIVARQKRPDGAPPIRVISDGTVF
ncbi:MAG: URC4/urg3 family protein [Pseudorhodoplanes sp.]